MAKITASGIREIEDLLSTVASEAETIAKKALYRGAGVIADGLKSDIHELPLDENHGTEEHPKKGPTHAQRNGLIHSLGISTMTTKNGVTDVSVGFSGYNTVKTKNWPEGQPNAMVARAVERGTSYMCSNQFIKPSIAKNKIHAIKEMELAVEDELKKITNQ